MGALGSDVSIHIISENIRMSAERKLSGKDFLRVPFREKMVRAHLGNLNSSLQTATVPA